MVAVRKDKRSRTAITFTLKLPVAMADRLDEMAERSDRSRAGLIRHILSVATGVSTGDPEPKPPKPATEPEPQEAA